MFWIQHPRTLGVLISLPAVPAMIFTLLWVLEPSDPSPPPTVQAEAGLIAGHDHVRRTLGLPAPDDAEAKVSERPMNPALTAALDADAVTDEAREPMQRVGIYRDGRLVGWVAASPAKLAAVAADNLEEMARRADRAQEASLVARQRFAEAHEMSLAHQADRASGGQRVVRERSDLVRLSRGLTAGDRGPRFERPEFVEALARDREETRRASNRRSRARR